MTAPILLLLCIVLSIAAGREAFAQVFATNAVAYINAPLVPGFSLMSNPLFTEDYSIADLTQAVQPEIPDGLTVYVLENGNFKVATYDLESGAFQPPEIAAEPLPPGRGFFVYNPSTNHLLAVLTGAILQGSLTNPLPQGFSLTASMIPQEGTLELLRFPSEPGDYLYLFDERRQSYEVSYFDELDGRWLPTPRPIHVAEAFVVFKRRPALWIREFHVN
jgi:hypothetical protein